MCVWVHIQALYKHGKEWQEIFLNINLHFWMRELCFSFYVIFTFSILFPNLIQYIKLLLHYYLKKKKIISPLKAALSLESVRRNIYIFFKWWS